MSAVTAFRLTLISVSPAASSVAIAQDRIREKLFLRDNGFGVVPFGVVTNEGDLAAENVAHLLPGVLMMQSKRNYITKTHLFVKLTLHSGFIVKRQHKFASVIHSLYR